MSARLEHWLRREIPTYRVTFSDLAASTQATPRIAVELFGVANKEVKLRHIQISKPSVALAPYLLSKYTTGSTGSTSGGQTLAGTVPLRTSDSSYAGVVRFYTNGPSSTAGTLSGILQDIDIAVTDVMNEGYGNPPGAFTPTLQGSSESFGIVISAVSSVLNGYIEFTLEP